MVGYILGGCRCITVAICQEYRKPNDGYELTTFHKFRDNWPQYQPDGKELTARYYETVPSVAGAINK